ncbi:MAG TPA: hypothetical protein VFN61_16030 [Acidimicrobiales bacterium]|nr:hypothetical protein [Acidimicrobiales bacterium]
MSDHLSTALQLHEQLVGTRFVDRPRWRELATTSGGGVAVTSGEYLTASWASEDGDTRVDVEARMDGSVCLHLDAGLDDVLTAIQEIALVDFVEAGAAPADLLEALAEELDGIVSTDGRWVDDGLHKPMGALFLAAPLPGGVLVEVDLLLVDEDAATLHVSNAAPAVIAKVIGAVVVERDDGAPGDDL